MSAPEPDPPRTNAVDDPEERVAQRVEEFLRLTDEGALVEPESFSAGLPDDIKSQVRQRCADILFVKRVLPWSGHASYRGDLAPGRQLGDFRLLRELGRGAMGVVYLARQVSLDRLVAVKVLPFAFSLSPRNVERFLRESHAAARLSHPAIVPIHAVGEQDGVRFFAMEYIQGRGLNEELEILRARRRDGLGPSKDDRLGTRAGHSYSAQVAEICARVAEGLQHAHEHGVIHRDVKPHNILLDRQGVPFLVDFGLAKDLQEESLTRTGEQPGTPFYMSPEQAVAKGAQIDRRTDVFSLGVVMYEMLTLARPFTGKTHRDILEAITVRDPKPIREHNRDVPRDLQVICMKAMEKGRERRYATAGAMAEDLRRFLGHESILARPPSLLEIGRRKLVRHRLAATAAAACALSLAAGFSWSSVQASNSSRHSAIAPLRELLTLPELASLGVDKLHDHQLAIARVRREYEPLAQNDARALGALEERIAAVGRDLADRGRRLRKRGLASPPSTSPVLLTDVEVPSDSDLVRGLLLLRQAAMLLPDDQEIRKLADDSALLAHVSITADVPGASVSLRRLSDVVCSPREKQLIGPTPVAQLGLEPGYWRVIVEVPGVGFCELTRYLVARGLDVQIAGHIRPTAEVTAQGMVLVPAGEFTFGDASSPGTINRMRTEHVDAFWIDRCEVSMGEYQAFLVATGRPPPSLWRRAYDPAWARLPAAGMTFHDAQAYAEWAGKRLPTQYEWSRAARGVDGFVFPWGDDEAELEKRARFGPPPAGLYGIDAFLAGAQPVESPHEGASPEGLLHMLDNVREWTETIAWRVDHGQATLIPSSRVLLGGSWVLDPKKNRPSLASVSQLTAHGEALEFGFRCAKSVDP